MASGTGGGREACFSAFRIHRLALTLNKALQGGAISWSLAAEDFGEVPNFHPKRDLGQSLS